jgi:hypothetical protein
MWGAITSSGMAEYASPEEIAIASTTTTAAI